jgi:hypothetical protein
LSVPRWLDKPRYKLYWREPWRVRARHSSGFKHKLWEHGYISPHFTRSEWACHDGTPVPSSLKNNAQRNAFHVEVFRHAVGDVSLPILSGYRTEAYNRQIGGATLSRLVQADAADFSKETVDKIGHSTFFSVADKLFPKGGVGEYPGGSAHLDSRGWRARWTSF